MNWNHAQHVIETMRGDEDLRDVHVRLTDGSIAPVELTRDDDGQWILVVSEDTGVERHLAATEADACHSNGEA